MKLNMNLFLDNGDVRQNKQSIFLAAQYLAQDEDLSHQGLATAGGQGIDEVATFVHSRKL